MKSILAILLVLLGLTGFSQSTQVTAPLGRNNTLDTGYATHIDSLGKGGWITLPDEAAKTNLPFSQRRKGMVVAIDSVKYQLVGGIANVNWVRFYFGGGSAPATPSIDSITVSRPDSLLYLAWYNGVNIFSYSTLLRHTVGVYPIQVTAGNADTVLIGCATCGTQTDGVTPGYVSYDTLLTFDVTAGSFLKNGVVYTVPAGSITLPPANGTFGRFDVIGWDVTGHIISVQGTPSATPEIPTVAPDQVYLTAVYIPVGATSININRLVVYDEHTEPGWTAQSFVVAGNFDDVSHPAHLIKNADIGAWSTSSYLQFTHASINISDYSLLTFHIKLKAPLSTGYIYLRFFNGSTLVTKLLVLNASYGFNKLSTEYQTINVPFSELNLVSQNITRVLITLEGIGSGLYLDYIQLQGGINNGSSNAITNVFRKAGTDSVFKTINNQNVFAYTDSIGSGGSGGSGHVDTIYAGPTYFVVKNIYGTRDTFDLAAPAGTDKVYAGGHLANTNDSTLNADTLSTNLRNEIAARQAQLVSGVNIRTINSQSLLGSTNLQVIVPADTNFLHGKTVTSFTKNTAQDSIILTLSDGTRFAAKAASSGGTTGISMLGVGFALTKVNDSTYNLDTANASVLSRQRAALTYEPIISVLPIAKGGTNNGSLSVTNGNLIYTDGTKEVGLGVGTAGQHLLGGTIPHWGDTAVAGSGASPGGLTTNVQYNNAGSFAGDTTFTWANLGSAYYNKKYAGLRISPSVTAQANTDTIVALLINSKYKANAKTGVKHYAMQINGFYLDADSLWNLSIGAGTAAQPTTGHTNFFGQEAGGGATSAFYSNFFGRFAGNSASGASYSNFFGNVAGYQATNASASNFFGYTAGQSAASANNSNFFGNAAGINAVSANNSNFFGTSAGSGATSASNSNFIGSAAGLNATGANLANFFGNSAGSTATGAVSANFIGTSAGAGATNAFYSNFIGNLTGAGATGGSYSNYFGWHVGDSLTFKITGTNNILIGTNITTPLAASTNMASIGNVLYLTNTYGTTTGNPASAAQTTGQVGINVNTPAASSALDVTSTTAGVLLPRMTNTQMNAISSPAALLHVSTTTDTALKVYSGVAWNTIAQWSYRAITATYTALLTDYTLDCTSGTFTATLPAVTNIVNKMYNIVNTGVGTITISSTNTFNGAASITLLAGHGVQVQAGSTQYVIISQY